MSRENGTRSEWVTAVGFGMTLRCLSFLGRPLTGSLGHSSATLGECFVEMHCAARALRARGHS